MKKTLIAAAFAAFAVTPVLAQQAWAPEPSPRFPAGQTYMYAPEQPANSFAFGQQGYVQGRMLSGDVAVSVDGKIVGQDPDANVRAELERNADYYLGRTGG